MRCQNCGKEMPEGANFCTECGAKVAEIETDEIHLNAVEQPREETAVPAPVETVAEETVAAVTAQMGKRKETLREKYFSFHGRLNRKRYILRSLLLWPLVILGMILLDGGFPEYPVAAKLLMYVISTILWVVGTSLKLRRLHDLNLSGWFLVPIYILIFMLPDVVAGAIADAIAHAVAQSIDICFMVTKGTEGDNKYGPDPLAK